MRSLPLLVVRELIPEGISVVKRTWVSAPAYIGIEFPGAWKWWNGEWGQPNVEFDISGDLSVLLRMCCESLDGVKIGRDGPRKSSERWCRRGGFKGR